MFKKSFVIFIISFISLAFSKESISACPALQQCLGVTPKYCSPENSKPNKKIKYDQEFCAPFKELSLRGLSYEDPVGRIIYTEL
mgnify:FL=1